MIRLKRSAPLLLFAFLAGAALPAQAQSSSYPNKPIRLIVAFPPGQATDIVARMMAQALGKAWHQSVVVFNYAGGNSVAGTMVGRNAAPDGYTITFATSSSIAVNPALYSNLPYNPTKDFVMVRGVFDVPIVIVADPGSPYTSLASFVQAAKQQPGKLAWGYGSTSMMLAAELFKLRAGVDIQGIPYKGSAPALTDLLGGQFPLLLDTPNSVMPQIQSGKLRPLAVMSPQRLPQLPQVPTVAELGYPGFAALGWGGLVVPKGTPPDVVEKLSDDVGRLLDEPDMQKEIEAQGIVPDSQGPRQWTRFVDDEVRKWAQVARQANVKMD